MTAVQRAWRLAFTVSSGLFGATLLILLTSLMVALVLQSRQIAVSGQATSAAWTVLWVSGLLTSVSYVAWRRTGPSWFSLLLVPIISFLLLIIGGWSGALWIAPGPSVASMQADGRTIHLTVDPQPTDRVYWLWQEEDSLGLMWRKLRVDLSYSEDGSFVGDERLGRSRDGRSLLVGRGGIWTDCVELSTSRRCDAGEPSWSDIDFDKVMRERSQEIAAAAGLNEEE